MSTLVFLDDPQRLRGSEAEALSVAAAVETGDGEVLALALGDPAPQVLSDLSRYGVRRVFVARPRPEHVGLSVVGGQAIAAAVASPAAGGVSTVLLTSSFAHKEIAADAAWRTGAGLLVDVASVERHDGRLRGRKRSFGGTWETECEVRTPVAIATLRPHAARPAPGPAGQSAEVVELEVRWAVPGGLQVTRSTPAAGGDGRPALAEAEIVVAAGRGTLGDFDAVYELADALGAAVGTTRDCVDEGWIGHEAQIGQTGVTIAPRLYIGAGISGAPHHHGGMAASEVIVAINLDPEAPLAEIADVVVVADLQDVLPAVADAVRERRRSPTPPDSGTEE